MSIQIKTINVADKVPIYPRDVTLFGTHVQSVNIFQTDGSFITSEPFNDRLIWYPQSPNRPSNSLMGQARTYSSFVGYGNLSFPMDARFDFTSRILYIADSGNRKLIKFEIDTNTVLLYRDTYLCHSIAINVNNGDVFVKSIKNSSTGIIQNYDKKGYLKNEFEFACEYEVSGDEVIKSYSFIDMIPLPSSMVFDHTRSRLWWLGKNIIYMADLYNKNIISYNINQNSLSLARGMDVDFVSGNAFIATKAYDGKAYLLQMSKDNNVIVSKALVTLDRIITPTPPDYGGEWLSKTVGFASICDGAFQAVGDKIGIIGASGTSKNTFLFVFVVKDIPFRITARLDGPAGLMEAGLCLGQEYFIGIDWSKTPQSVGGTFIWGGYPNDKYLRITVQNNTVTMEHSLNGSSWVLSQSVPIMAGHMEVGIFSNICSLLEFDNVLVENL